jgi:hypothetical protein
LPPLPPWEIGPRLGDLTNYTRDLHQALTRRQDGDWRAAARQAAKIEATARQALSLLAYREPKGLGKGQRREPRPIEVARADVETAQQLVEEVKAGVDEFSRTKPQDLRLLQGLYDRLNHLRAIARQVRVDAQGRR